jgi:hypothetical protein
MNANPQHVTPSYTPHTVSCGCCANGCACWTHAGRDQRTCAYHTATPHPHVTHGDYARSDAIYEARQYGRHFTPIAKSRA